MTYRIITEIPRSGEDAEICKKLSSYGVATVAESQEKTGIMDTNIRPVISGKSVSGTAVTVMCSDGDNLMIHAALEYCKKGDFLIVSTISSTRNGYFGELMATAAQKKGVVGLVIDGGVRDIDRLREIGFPAWSRYVCVAGTSKIKPGWVNTSITCANVSINPGDFVTADGDGVVVTKREDVHGILSRAEERSKKEEGVKERISRGESSVDFYSLRQVIEGLKIEII